MSWPGVHACVWVLLGGLACKSESQEAGRSGAVLVAPVAQATGGGASATSGSAILWLDDDYRAALAQAQARHLPIVIDMWAPWCHTCLSMQQNVLYDPALAPFAARFVWLALDTDKPENAVAVGKFPPSAWPTFFVIGEDESVQAQQVGSASLADFAAFLTRAEAATRAGRTGTGSLDEASAELRAGDQAATKGDFATAEAAYERAVAATVTPASWTAWPHAMVALADARHSLGKWESCVVLVEEALEPMAARHSAALADLVYFGSECSGKLSDPNKALALRQKSLLYLDKLLADPQATLTVDDRSESMRIAREIELGLGHAEAARNWALRQRRVLDEATRAATSAEVRMTYNWPRAEVYMFLGTSSELVDDLKRSVAELPEQYDPPFRLAGIYLAMKKPDLALPLAQKALGLAYGPRKARVQMLLAQIQQARGDESAYVAAVVALVDLYEALPDGQRQPEPAKKARELLASIRARTDASKQRAAAKIK